MLCEGYMDVIAMHAAGFENAVATLGTAITSEQARIFAKYTKKVVICYDADGPGQAAAKKAMRLLGEVGVEVRVLKISGAKDPDEYIKKFGIESFKKAIGESKSGFDYLLERIIDSFNLEIADDKIKASEEAIALIVAAYSEVQRDLYVKKASERIGVSAEAMKNDVERRRKKLIRDTYQKESTDAKMSVKNLDTSWLYSFV